MKGKDIKLLRLNAGISQKQLAEKMKVDVQVVKNTEANNNEIDLSIIILYANCCGFDTQLTFEHRRRIHNDYTFKL